MPNERNAHRESLPNPDALSRRVYIKRSALIVGASGLFAPSVLAATSSAALSGSGIDLSLTNLLNMAKAKIGDAVTVLDKIRNLPSSTQPIKDALDIALVDLNASQSAVNAAIASASSLSSAEVAAIKQALMVLIPILDCLISDWGDLNATLDNKIAIFPAEPIGSTVQLLGSGVDAVGGAFQSAGDAVTPIPIIGPTVGLATKAVGTTLNAAGAAIGFLGSLIFF